jgi:hypothetical protein
VVVRRVALVDAEERRRSRRVVRKMIHAGLHWRFRALARYIL